MVAGEDAGGGPSGWLHSPQVVWQLCCRRRRRDPYGGDAGPGPGAGETAPCCSRVLQHDWDDRERYGSDPVARRPDLHFSGSPFKNHRTCVAGVVVVVGLILVANVAAHVYTARTITVRSVRSRDTARAWRARASTSLEIDPEERLLRRLPRVPINLTVRRNTIVALIGPSGCGNSTFSAQQPTG